MSRLFRFFFHTTFLVLFLGPTAVRAAGPALTLLTEPEFENLSKEFSANFMHHSVQGAGTLGTIFGFELGLIGGQQASPKINEIVKRSGGSELPNLYHAGILGVLSVPFGLTGEIVLLPKISSNNADFQTSSVALKWTLNETLFLIPFNLVVRGSYSSSIFSFKQDTGGSLISVENQTKVTGLQLLVSPKLPFIEPYVGLGYLSGKNTLSASGGSLFDPAYSTSLSMEKSPNSTQILIGVTGSILFFHLGAEYSNAFGASSYSGKLAFGF